MKLYSIFILIFFIGLTQKLSAQDSIQAVYKDIKIDSVYVDDIPDNLHYDGEIKNAWKFEDKYGVHYVLSTNANIYLDESLKPENDSINGEIFVYHFLVKKKIAQLAFKINEKLIYCPTDDVSQFIGDNFHITDLDNNGYAEIWLMYDTYCEEEDKPNTRKLMMFEGMRKFVMIGESTYLDRGGQEVGGKYEFDKAFSKGPQLFRDFADQMWKKGL